MFGKELTILETVVSGERRMNPVASDHAGNRTSEQEVAGSNPGLTNTFLGIDDSHCNRIHSPLS